jgi:hypothetical protein
VRAEFASVAAATRRCYDCGEIKPIAEFAFHNKAKGTRQGRCRKCHAAYRRDHYLRNRDTYITQEVARIKRYRDENRPLLREYLRAHPCVDCGETDIVLLDFDHRDPATKRYLVVVLALHKPWSRVLAEIAKCDVRCANCHRRRTAKQFNWRSRIPSTERGRPPLEMVTTSTLIFSRLIGAEAERMCTGCKLVKPNSEFGFKDRTLGKRRSRCLACTRAYARRHYKLNRPKYLKKARRNRRRTFAHAHQRIRDYLTSHPCVDCGETDLLLLDFDHKDPALKIDEVSRLVRRRPWSAVLSEIAKCDVRCANCHRRKTARQFGWMRLKAVAA